MKFYSLSKEGKMYSRKNGEGVERYNWDRLAIRERELRKDLTLENVKFKILDFLDATNLSSGNKLAASVMTINFIALLDFILKSPGNQSNPDKIQEDLKEEIKKDVV